MNDTDTKRHRRGGRERRDPNAKPSAPSYIRRNIPTYDIMGEENLLKIEAAADRILAEVGLDIRDDDECLALFRTSGARVDGMRVRFEPGHLREILKTAPREFTQHARNPARSVQIGGNNVVFAPAYGSPFVMDLDKGRRYGTLEDFQNFIKLAYNCPWLHHSGGTVCEPTDVPVNKRHLDMVYSHIRYSDKAYMGSITSAERAEDSIEMSRLLFGADFVDQNCVILGNVNVNSPLLWDGTMTTAARAYARANPAAAIVPFILGGAMGPVTNAGAIAQSLAETMVGCAITQLERPGAPVIFGNFLSSMSLRSGSPTFGTPEPAVGSMVIGQLARRLGLPLRCAGSFTTSKLPDGQAMQESVMSMLSAVHCGANFILHSAGFLDGLLAMSYEKFMMDADFCGALHSYMAGVTVDDNTLAIDAFKDVGPGSHFLGCAHTMANYTTVFFDSTISDDRPFETWSEDGSRDSASRANARWKASLAEYQAPPIDEAVDESIRAATGFPTFHAAKIQDVTTARHAIASGKLDMVGMTRAHLTDPHIVRKIMLGKEDTIRPCVGANFCLDRIYQGGEAYCIHNPASGRELTMPHEVTPAAVQRKVVVVGAGPAGLEAARVAAERGHAVVVLEAAPKAGGQIRLTSQSPRRREMIGIIDWRLARCEERGVQMRFNTLADAETVRAEKPDVVIIATGGLPHTEVLSAGNDLVVSSWDILGGDVKPGRNVLLFDDAGDHPALQAAEVIAATGARVEIMTPDRAFAPEVMAMNLVPYMRSLQKHDVTFTVTFRLQSVQRDGDGLRAIVGSDYGGVRKERRVDQVVVNHGTRPLDDLYFELKPLSDNHGAVDYTALIDGQPQAAPPAGSGAFQLFRIGDAVSARNTHAAIYDALRLAKDL